MKSILIVTTIAIVGLVVPASAQSRAGRYEACKAAAGGVTTALRTCDASELAVRDQTLNAAYQQVVTALPPERRLGLRTAQRAWLGFRDAECAFRRSADEGGTDAVLIANTCRLDLTTARTEDLRKALRVAQF